MNGVPGPQTLGHILSEDLELNEISDELSQVFLVFNKYISVALGRATAIFDAIILISGATEEDGETAPTASIATTVQGQDVQRASIQGSDARQHRGGKFPE